jgi:predicted lipoprotein
MNKILSSLALVSVLVLGISATASANTGSPLLTHEEFQARARRAEALAERVKRIHTYEKKLNKLRFGQETWHRRGPSADVPELDPNAAGGALTLLVGGAFVLADRRKRLLTD